MRRPPMSMSRLPMLRVCVTSRCNMRCIYCTSGGECRGHYEDADLRTLIRLIKLLNELGIKDIRVTGGEPLLYDELPELLTAISSLKARVSLVTNGWLLGDYIELLSNLKLDEVTVSVDATNPEAYAFITGTRADVYYEVIDNIKRLVERGVRVRINSVALKGVNYPSITPLVALSRGLGTDLKLIELISTCSSAVWARYHVVPDPLCVYSQVADDIVDISLKWLPRGLGVPMATFRFKWGRELMVVSTALGSTYHGDCLRCKFFPCQTGLYAIRLLPDGSLLPCLMRNDNMLKLDELSSTEARRRCKELLKRYGETVWLCPRPQLVNDLLSLKVTMRDKALSATRFSGCTHATKSLVCVS